MQTAKLLFRSMLVAMTVLFTVQTASAEAPGKPIEFGAQLVEEGTMVKLSWMANREGGEPTEFCIYYAEGETENMDDFSLLAETDSEPNPNGLYTYLVKDLEPGEYTFYVVAKNDDGESGRSIIRVVEIKEEEEDDGKPCKPVEFGAQLKEEGTVVRLVWLENWECADATVFCIFIAEGETENMDDFELLAEVEAEPNTREYDYNVNRSRTQARTPSTWSPRMTVAVVIDQGSRLSPFRIRTSERWRSSPSQKMMVRLVNHGTTRFALKRNFDYDEIEYSLVEGSRRYGNGS